MAIVHADLLKDPFVFNSDRNNWMVGGGVLTWSAGAGPTHTWTWTQPIYINWLAGRSTGAASNRGTATYNTIPANPVGIPIPINNVAYVTIDAENDGVALGITVCAGTALPQNDNIFVLCSHRDVGLGNQNPLQMRWGNSIATGQSYNASAGFPTLGYANNYTGATWTVNHALSSTDVFVQCLDNGTPRNIIWPQNIAITDANNVTITWSSAVTGRAIIMKIV